MIEMTREGALAFITLNYPAARNAVSVLSWHRLAQVAEELRDSDVRVVVMRSAVANVFSSGADMREFDSFVEDPAARTAFRLAMRAGIDGLAALPVPVIAVVDGGCYGAAVAMAAACDLIVAGDGARFATPPARLGLSYPREDVARIVARVGRGGAANMFFTGVTLDPDAALRMGLADVRAASAEAEALAMARAVAASAPGAIRAIKRTLDAPGDSALDRLFEDRFATEELAEGLAAFRARRHPDFR